MKKMFLLSFLFISINCYAFSTQKGTLRQLIQYSEFVAVIHVNSVEKIGECGYLVKAKIIQSYKGRNNDVKFWVTDSFDINNDTKKYFVAANQRKKQTVISDTCAISDLYTGLGSQSIFPFDIVDKEFILANRKSFLSLSDGWTYNPTDRVKKFKVIKNRIHAVAEWVVIEKEINDILLKLN
jgi:hypothetical protein